MGVNVNVNENVNVNGGLCPVSPETPTRYAGDFGQREQRLAQFGLRLDF